MGIGRVRRCVRETTRRYHRLWPLAKNENGKTSWCNPHSEISNQSPLQEAAAKAHHSWQESSLSLTLDNGIENKQHAAITAATGAKAFFCDPYSSWQKGGVENANKMLETLPT